MFCEPEAFVAQSLHVPGQVHRSRNRAARTVARVHINQLENRYRQSVVHADSLSDFLNSSFHCSALRRLTLPSSILSATALPETSTQACIALSFCAPGRMTDLLKKMSGWFRRC